MSRRAIAATAVGATAAVAATFAARVAGRTLVARTERRMCATSMPGPYPASDRARALHARLEVVDLHADYAAVGS